VIQHTASIERLAAGQKAYARGIRPGVEIAGDDDRQAVLVARIKIGDGIAWRSRPASAAGRQAAVVAMKSIWSKPGSLTTAASVAQDTSPAPPMRRSSASTA
jgi:hypothetical protein